MIISDIANKDLELFVTSSAVQHILNILDCKHLDPDKIGLFIKEKNGVITEAYYFYGDTPLINKEVFKIK
jgi:hypothetical protein